MSRNGEQSARPYKLMTLPDFCAFRALALSEAAAWTTHYSDAVLTVQSRPPDDAASNLNIIRARRIMARVPPEVLYNQLHDAQYRVTWDKNMIEGYNIEQLDAHNDIGYYAAKFPWPLANRDFCNMRSWMEFTNGEYIIMNHSEPHPRCPEKKGFVRARSILTGFYMRPYGVDGAGTELIYVTHSDPCGSIPHTIINFAMTKGARMILNNCEKCSEEYPAFAAKTYPREYVFPWRTPKVSWDGSGGDDDGATAAAAAAGGGDDDAKAVVPRDGSDGDEHTTAVASSPSLRVQASTSDVAAVMQRNDSDERQNNNNKAHDAGAEQATQPLPLSSPSLLLSPPAAAAAAVIAAPLPPPSPPRAAVAAAEATRADAATAAVPSPATNASLSLSAQSGVWGEGAAAATSIEQFRATMREQLDVVDRSFAREQHAPSTTEYLLRLRYALEGIRCTAAP